MEKQIDKESISKRDIILNESFRLFLKKGYAAVSFSDLVEATGISRGNMFHHFKNKEDIFNHAVDRFVFEFLTNDATDFLEFTSSTPLKDFIDNRVENIGRRMKSFFIMTRHSHSCQFHVIYPVSERQLSGLEREVSRIREKKEP